MPQLKISPVIMKILRTTTPSTARKRQWYLSPILHACEGSWRFLEKKVAWQFLECSDDDHFPLIWSSPLSHTTSPLIRLKTSQGQGRVFLFIKNSSTYIVFKKYRVNQFHAFHRDSNLSWWQHVALAQPSWWHLGGLCYNTGDGSHPLLC